MISSGFRVRCSASPRNDRVVGWVELFAKPIAAVMMGIAFAFALASLGGRSTHPTSYELKSAGRRQNKLGLVRKRPSTEVAMVGKS